MMGNYFNNSPCDTCLIDHIIIKSKKDTSIVLHKKKYIIDAPYPSSDDVFEEKLKSCIR